MFDLTSFLMRKLKIIERKNLKPKAPVNSVFEIQQKGGIWKPHNPLDQDE